MSKAIKKNGYYYDPPSWRVCPECDGSATVETKKKSGIGSMLNGAVYTMVEKCQKCANSSYPGYLSIRYTPEEWKAAGGILTDDTPVWIQAKNGQWMEGLYWDHDENSHGTPFIIATSAGRPEVEK